MKIMLPVIKREKNNKTTISKSTVYKTKITGKISAIRNRLDTEFDVSLKYLCNLGIFWFAIN